MSTLIYVDTIITDSAPQCQTWSIERLRKSGSTRTLIATRFADVLFFLYGFEKSERENFTARELALYQRLARELLGLSEEQIATALAGQALREVTL